MLRKIAIGLAAAAIAMGGSTLSASAMRGGPQGGGGMQGGGGPHGGGGMQGGGGPHGGGGMQGGGGPHGGKVGDFGSRGGGGRYAMGDRYRHDHWRGRYGYYGGYRPYGYTYGGSCWRWTPEGRVWVCGGGYGPSYRYGYY